MKKFLSMLLVGVLVVSMVSCGKENTDAEENGGTGANGTNTEASENKADIVEGITLEYIIPANSNEQIGNENIILTKDTVIKIGTGENLTAAKVIVRNIDREAEEPMEQEITVSKAASYNVNQGEVHTILVQMENTTNEDITVSIVVSNIELIPMG